MPQKPPPPHTTAASGQIQNVFAQAIESHKRGDLAAAEQGYLAVLSANAQELEARYLLGTVLVQCERDEEAITHLTRYIERHPTHTAALNTLGAALSKTGQTDHSLEIFGRAVESQPNDLRLLVNMGRAARDGNKFPEGANAFELALQIDPRHIEATVGYANCIAELDKIDKAIDALEQLIEKGETTPGLYASLLEWLLADRRFENAHDRATAARNLWPDNDDFVLADATALRHIYPKTDALPVYEELIKRDPDNPAHLNKFSDYLFSIGRWIKAEEYARRAIELDPLSIGAVNNLGRIRQQVGDLDGARKLYEDSIAAIPDYADAHNNLANLLLYMDKVDESIASYNRAIELKPDSKDYYFNRSMALMTKGRIREHISDHDLRFEKKDPMPSRAWPWPAWTGEPLSDKRVLVWGEQGIGDEIIHARCMKRVAVESSTCVLECSPRLTTLFERSFPDAEMCPYTKQADERLIEGPFDFHASALDMNCRAYEDVQDIPGTPYLRPDLDVAHTLRQQYQQVGQQKPLVGISWWSGGTYQAHFKSTPLDSWKPILGNEDVTFVNLQYGDWRKELSLLESEDGLKVIQDENIDPLGDLDLFAAQVAAMDLVITISNATAHLAGALGVPVWNMTPTGPGRLWYWFLEGSTCPWYDSMRLFRHTYDEGWDANLQEINDLLVETIPHLGNPRHLQQ